MGDFALFFAGTMPAGAFAPVIAAEALLWRPAELVIIVNNGMGRFGRAAMLAIIGAAMRAAAAVAFIAMPASGLDGWTLDLSRRQRGLARSSRSCSSIRASGCVLKTGLYFSGCPTRSTWPAPRCCSICRWSSTSCWCWRSAGPARRHLRHHHAAGRPDGDPDPRLLDDAGAAHDAGARNAGAAWRSAPASKAASSRSRRWRCCASASSCISSRSRSAGMSPRPRRWWRWRSACPACATWSNTRPSFCSARGQMLLRALNLALLAGAKAALLTWLLARVADTDDLVLALNAVFAAIYLLPRCSPTASCGCRRRRSIVKLAVAHVEFRAREMACRGEGGGAVPTCSLGTIHIWSRSRW